MKKFGGFLAAALAACSVFAATAFAEGSKDLNDLGNLPYGKNIMYGTKESRVFDENDKTQDSRVYLSWSCANSGGAAMRTVVYAYVKAGETVYFGSSIGGSGASGEKKTSANSIRSARLPYDKYNSESTDDVSAFTGAAVAVTLPQYDEENKKVIPNLAVEPNENMPFAWGDSKNEALYNEWNYKQAQLRNKVLMFSPVGKNGTGIIQNQKQEETGPVIEGIEGSKGGYIPFSFTAPVTGTYAFRFLSERYADNGEYDTSMADNIKVTECTQQTIKNDWNKTVTQADNQHSVPDITYQGSCNVAAWDITVVGTDKQVKSGRVFSDLLVLNAGNHNSGVYSDIFTLTSDGFLYNIKLNGMSPNVFSMYSNTRGFLETSGGAYKVTKPLLHSIYDPTNGDGTVGITSEQIVYDSYGNPMKDSTGTVITRRIDLNNNPKNAAEGEINKMFFNRPDDECIAVYTQKGHLTSTYKDIDNKMPEITYKGYNSDNNSSICGTGGTFSFEISEDEYAALDNSKTLSIELDFSGYALEAKKVVGSTVYVPVKDRDGNWLKVSGREKSEQERNNKVKLECVVEIGTNKVRWDGYDAFRNIVSNGNYTSLASAKWQAGAIHFPFVNVDVNPNGLIFERLNQVIDMETNEEFEKNKYNICYNNEGYPTLDGKDKYFLSTAGKYGNNYPTKMADGVNALSGVDSRDGAMKYYIYDDVDAQAWTNPYSSAEVGKLVIPYLMSGYDERYKSEELRKKLMFRAGFAYGAGVAVDTWSSYVGNDSKTIDFVVRSDKKESVSPATVSFVSQNSGVVLDSTNKEANYKTHIREYGTAPQINAAHLGNAELGNTVSTGFVTSVFDSSADVKEYSTLMWSVSIPMQGVTYSFTDADGNVKSDTAQYSYIKIEDDKVSAQLKGENPEEFMMSIADLFGDNALMEEVSLGAEDEIEEIGEGENPLELTAVSLYDYESEKEKSFEPWNVTLKLQSTPVLADENVAVHSGKIYKILGAQSKDEGTEFKNVNTLKLDFKYNIKDTGEGQKAVYGMIIDDIYAPNAYASVAYYKNGDEPDKYVQNDYSNTIYSAVSASEYVYPKRPTSNIQN